MSAACVSSLPAEANSVAFKGQVQYSDAKTALWYCNFSFERAKLPMAMFLFGLKY